MQSMIRTILLSAVSIATLATLSTTALAETRAVDLDAFTSASFESTLNAKIVVGGEQSVSIEVDNPADLDDIRLEVVNGALRVWRDNDIWDYLSFRRGPVTVTISVPELKGIEASAASGVEATGITGDTLDVSVSSASFVVLRDVAVNSTDIRVSSVGRLLIEGSSTTAKIETSSAGIIGAGKFEVVDVDIVASSASQTLMFASGLVTADASSAAIIEIAGHPLHVDDEVNSGADVNILE
jgi:hypothetical protein